MPSSTPNRSRPASFTLAAMRVAWLLERLSRGLSRHLFAQNRPLMPRHHHVHEARALSLDTPLRAALKPPREFVFIPEDEYFREVESVLQSLP